MVLKRSLLLSCVAVLASAVPATLWGQVPSTPSAAGLSRSAQAFTFAFRDADVAQVAEEILGVALGVAYTIDPVVTGKVSFRIDRRLTRPQLLEAFEAALAVSEIALLRQGDSLVLVPREKARGTASLRGPGAVTSSSARRGGYDVVAAPLSFAKPTEVAKALEAMTGSKAVLYANDSLGLIVLGGSGSELDAALETIKVFDRNVFEGARIRWFQLNQASAAAVSADLNRILTTAGVQGVALAPLKRLNGLIVAARTEPVLNEVAAWVARLDTPSRDLSTQLYVYRPRSASAQSLARTLTQVLSTNAAEGSGQSSLAASARSQTPDNPTTTDEAASGAVNATSETLEDGVRIGVDKDSNTLIVRAPAARWIGLQETLAQIDRPPSQVMIEASIIEVSLTNDFRFGVDWRSLGSDKLTTRSIYQSSGVIGPSFPGFSVTFLGGDIDAAVNALGSRTDIDVVSAPKLVTLDNHKAHLSIGDQVPIVTQTATSTTTSSPALVSTVEYRNTGVILDVTPRISGDDKVVLEISQEVSAVAKTITSGIDSPTIQQRKFESTLVLKDGAVVALGGLISQRRSKTNSGLPGLKDVRVLGNLFKSQGRDEARTELIVLLTARIVRDPEASDQMTESLLLDMREIEARGLAPR